MSEVTLDITISTSGGVRRVGRAPGDDSAAACIDAVLENQVLVGDVDVARTTALSIRRDR